MSAAVALLIDFGNAYTKLRAVDLADGRLLAASQAPSTVDTDVTRGYAEAFMDLRRRLRESPRYPLPVGLQQRGRGPPSCCCGPGSGIDRGRRRAGRPWGPAPG